MLERLITGLLYILPQHLISRVVLYLSHSEKPWIRNPLIALYTRVFTLNLGEALEPKLSAYKSLNALFTRALAAGARPLPDDPDCLVSPADGVVSEIGAIDGNRLIQAKGYYYDLDRLCGGYPELANAFRDGGFATVYLSPRDYHRLHMPLDGRLTDMIYVPGRLFSVSPMTTRNIPEIFTRNERLICLFDTDFGKLGLVLVGAINVAAIETVWAGLVTPPRGKTTRHTHYDETIFLKRGTEMGRFNMGSTIIVLTEKDRFDWLNGMNGSAIKLGETLGNSSDST